VALVPSRSRRLSSSSAGDQAVVLNTAVAGEIEDRGLAEDRCIEIAGMDQQLIIIGLRLDSDLAIGIDDQRASEQGVSVLDAGLRDRDAPCRVLISASLHTQPIVKEPPF